MRIAAFIAGLSIAALARGQDLSIAYRNAAMLGTTARDQAGQTFTVAGLSGITHAGGTSYWAIMDNSDRAVRLEIDIDDAGMIRSAAIAGGLRLAQSRDHEDLAWTASGFLACEETTPALHEYDAATGALRATVMPPAIFATRRPNFGFESLTMDAAGSTVWAANEEALEGDGPVSTPSTGTRVRLQRWSRTALTASPSGQYGYLTAPMHAGNIQAGRSGLSALVLLPSGRLLAMERSFANNFLRFFETRIYEVDFTGATDTSGLASLTQPHTPVGKRLLYQGGQTNLEGLCLGPRVDSGYVLLGIVDDGDPISVNRVVSFVVSGPVDPPCDADFNGDAFLDFFDYDAYVRCYETSDCPAAHSDADFNRDGFVDFFDYDAFVEAYLRGC